MPQEMRCSLFPSLNGLPPPGHSIISVSRESSSRNSRCHSVSFMQAAYMIKGMMIIDYFNLNISDTNRGRTTQGRLARGFASEGNTELCCGYWGNEEKLCGFNPLRSPNLPKNLNVLYTDFSDDADGLQSVKSASSVDASESDSLFHTPTRRSRALRCFQTGTSQIGWISVRLAFDHRLKRLPITP